MDRLTTDKPVEEMGMIELSLNCCYGKDGWVRYQDFDIDIDLLDLMREFMDSYAPESYIPAENNEFVEVLWDNLQFNPIVDGSGIVALLHRNMWALAELRARLKSYEDTGLIPEEISELKSQYEGHWLELFRAEQDGRLIVLPCKVGDTVYALKDTELFTQVVVPLRVQGISIDRKNKFVLHFGGYPFVSAEESAIGKRVFLTREEAEAALEEKK